MPPDKYLNSEQIIQLYKSLKKEAEMALKYRSTRSVVNKMLVELMLETGLRATELCCLQLRDLPSHHGKEVILVRDGKGHVLRTIKVKAALRDKLGGFIKKYRSGARPGSQLFVSERGYRLIHTRKKVKKKIVIVRERTARLTYQSLYERIKGIGKRAGIPQIFPHMLRHTYLTRLYNIEKDLRFVQDQAGHASPTTTAIYAKTNNTVRKRQVEALDEEEF